MCWQEKQKSATLQLSTVTDYDVWKDHVVSVDDILATMKTNIENVKRVIAETIAKTAQRMQLRMQPSSERRFCINGEKQNERKQTNQ